MSKKYKIVHISQTPLVAAPSKIALAQRLSGHDAIAVALNDYPIKGPLAGKFIEEYILESEFTKPLIDAAIRAADIIHVHNDIPDAWAERLISSNQSARYFYQAHSPLREGPLYLPRHTEINLPFSASFVVGQFQPRIHKNSIFVPNIVHDVPGFSPREKNQKLRVIFSPTHQRPGRWNNKHVEKLDVAIDALVRLGKIEAVIPTEPVSPKTLMAMRKTCHVTIDEIATGGFHQVSIEGLAAGNVTVNRADFFCKAVFSNFADGVSPPFVYATGESIASLLEELANDWQKTVELQEQSLEYFKAYLTPEKMATVFDQAYETI
jgi:hypothetical protein